MGLREIKKAKQRKQISDIARELFLAKGYSAVTVAEIATQAEVAVTTVFNYFPSKESLVFDREDEMGIEMLEALQQRQPEHSILEALQNYFLSSKLFNPPDSETYKHFISLVKSSPELATYFRSIWTRYEPGLAQEIQSTSGMSVISELEAQGMARLILESVSFACYADQPKAALNLMFKILKQGWDQ